MKKLDLIAVPILVDGDKLIRHFETIDVPLKRYFILDNSMGKDPCGNIYYPTATDVTQSLRNL